MGYYTVTDGGPDNGQFDDFDEALDFSLDCALTKAADDGIDEEDIDTFVNGQRGPWPNTGDFHGRYWEAGACPRGSDGAYWPHVKWRD